LRWRGCERLARDRTTLLASCLQWGTHLFLIISRLRLVLRTAIAQMARAGKLEEGLDFFKHENTLDYILAKLGKPYVVIMEGITSTFPFILFPSLRICGLTYELECPSGRRSRSSLPSSSSSSNVHDQLCYARDGHRVRTGCRSVVLPGSVGWMCGCLVGCLWG